ncbi:MAG TPA: hypothetical protein VF475_14405 [Sphingobium sp.]
MTQTGWIIVAVIAVAAIILLTVLLRRKPGSPLPVETAARTPVAPPPSPAQPTHVPPQTIAAEETPPAPSVPVIEGMEEIEAIAPIAPPVQQELPVAPEPVAESVTVTTPPAPPAIAPAEGDNLLKLKGVGPKLAALLRAEGVTRFADIAGWSDADLAAIDPKLGSFAGRPTRDNWIDQARFLAAGDVAGYEAKYGKL